MSESNYRALTTEEIDALKSKGSVARDWANVTVTDGFDPSRIWQVYFSGTVKLGKFTGTATLAGGTEVDTGIYASALHNVTVGDDALINDVKLLANYEVGTGAVLSGVNSMAVEGESSFGNGTEIDVYNEGGGRELPLYDRLSSQIAYMMVTYRHRPQLAKSLGEMIKARVTSLTSSTGTIGANARIINSNKLENVCVGEAAVIDGAQLLSNGTVVSSTDAPTTVGAGVVAENFIINTASKVDGGAMLKNSFVGQACKIGRQYSAEGSTFFANCEGFHGEACSVFAGPYTVTHHKSSLIIAGILSFYNAGSGTNQSNHMYKLGPLHQGILERGSKTGSFSYLLWPSRVGAFSAVLGKHYANFDTSEFPFSYVDENHGESILTPAMNLFTVGTRRDGDKWPKRDGRKGEKLDQLIFDVLSPYTCSKMIKGVEVASKIYAEASKDLEYVRYNGIKLKRLLLRTAKKYYAIGITKYLGGLIVDRLKAGQSLESPADTTGTGEWVDVLGLLAPKSVVESLCDRIESGEIASLGAIEAELKSIKDNYANYVWAWAVEAWTARAGKAPSELTNEELTGIVADWAKASAKLNNMILGDAEKEFDVVTRTGFGIDGDEAVRDADFEAVRGTFEGNAFVKLLKEEVEGFAKTKEELTAKLA